MLATSSTYVQHALWNYPSRAFREQKTKQLTAHFPDVLQKGSCLGLGFQGSGFRVRVGVRMRVRVRPLPDQLFTRAHAPPWRSESPLGMLGNEVLGILDELKTLKHRLAFTATAESQPIQQVMVVGKAGAGKSTLVNHLMHACQKVRVRVRG